MVIAISHELEAALREQAEQEGLSPEEFVVSVLQTRLLKRPLDEPRDDWERKLRSIARNFGPALSNEALSSDGIYD